MRFNHQLARIKNEIEMLKKEPVDGVNIIDITREKGEKPTISCGNYNETSCESEEKGCPFSLTFSEHYPFEPPVLQFDANIKHSRINEEQYLDLDIFDRWTPKNDITDVFQGTMDLFHMEQPVMIRILFQDKKRKGDLLDLYLQQGNNKRRRGHDDEGNDGYKQLKCVLIEIMSDEMEE